MRKLSILFLFFLTIITIDCISQTSVYNGNISGVWSKEGSPYIIYGDLFIPAGQQLIIEPGVKIEFTGFYAINIAGVIIAIGSENDSIVFTSQNVNVKWHGLRFGGDTADDNTEKSYLTYCIIEHSSAVTESDSDLDPDNLGGAINIGPKHQVVISNCLIRDNEAKKKGGAIYAVTDLEITNTIIINNKGESGGAVFMGNFASLKIIGSLISHNTAKQQSAFYATDLN